MLKNLTTPSKFCIFVVLFEEQFLRLRASAIFSVCTSKVSCAKAQKWSEKQHGREAAEDVAATSVRRANFQF